MTNKLKNSTLESIKRGSCLEDTGRTTTESYCRRRSEQPTEEYVRYVATNGWHGVLNSTNILHCHSSGIKYGGRQGSPEQEPHRTLHPRQRQTGWRTSSLTEPHQHSSLQPQDRNRWTDSLSDKCLWRELARKSVNTTPNSPSRSLLPSKKGGKIPLLSRSRSPTR